MSVSRADNEPIAQLGPFDVLSFLGRGAMGQVWRARHREQRVDAAIKIITEDQAQHEDYQRRFRHEVRAVASLSHPGIVMVFDYGSVTEEVEQATFGELRANNPYLAMELCPKGSLDTFDGQMSFAQIRSILLSLLDSLAHAHARGIIHRDLKPSNILLGADADWTGVKLTDFGLAFIPERLEADDTSRQGACGTPAFMPPEQLLGKWRDLGPWSDLYSLGCVAYQMVCGRPPYMGNSIVEVAQKHLRRPIPALAPAIAVPDEFEGWVRRLLHKDEHDRFRNAADAAWQLLLMDASEGDDSPEALSGMPAADTGSSLAQRNTSAHQSTLVLHHFENLVASTGSNAQALASDVEADNPSVGGDEKRDDAPTIIRTAQCGAPTKAPLPASWHHLIGRRPSIQLLGAGLGLYGLRHIPLIGRDTERDVLWQQLLDVVQNTTPRAVLLRGPAGTGKSYLAQWICERARETGAAVSLEATHSPSPGGGEGLTRMLARYFRTAGLDRAEILERLRSWFVARGDLDPYVWDALTEFLKPATDDDVASGQRKIHFGSVEQRNSLIARVIGLISNERPVVVWLDDLQWASDSLSLMRYVLDSDACRDLPVLFVATLREDALADQSAVRSQLATLAVDEKVERLSLGPLPANIQAELIEKLLYLAPSLARKVADRTRGNPLFAVQLIGDWVDRGVLKVADEGFMLADGEQALIPDDLFDIWSSRLNEVVSEVGGEDIRALEIAAVLGMDVDESEWRACLALIDCDFPSQVVQQLLSHRLVEDTDTGLRFVHGMLRESLERRAKEAGRLLEHNRVCARMLSERYENERRLAERLGRHLLAARAYLDALDPLLAGAKTRGNAGELDTALVLLDLHLDAIEALELPKESAPYVENWELRALALVFQGELDEGYLLAKSAVDTAEKLDEPCLQARCLVRLAQCMQQQENFHKPLDLLERAQQLATSASCDNELLIQIGELTGTALRDLGKIEQALERLQATRQIAVACGKVFFEVALSREIGSCERRRGNLAKAETMLREALTLCERIGLQLRIGDTLQSLADVVRLRGRLDEAEELYRKAYQAGRTVRPGVANVAQINLALVQVQRKHYQEAAAILEELRPMFERDNQDKWLFYTDAIALPCLAADASWATFDRTFDHVVQTIERYDIVDDDVAICLEQAGGLAASAGRLEAARRAFTVALAQWDQSANTEKARATRQELDRIVALHK